MVDNKLTFDDFFLEGKDENKWLKYKGFIIDSIGAEYYEYQDSHDRFYISLTHLIPNFWIAEVEMNDWDSVVRSFFRVVSGKEAGVNEVIEKINNALPGLLKAFKYSEELWSQ